MKSGSAVLVKFIRRKGGKSEGECELDGHTGSSLTECVKQGFPNSNLSCGQETPTILFDSHCSSAVTSPQNQELVITITSQNSQVTTIVITL